MTSIPKILLSSSGHRYGFNMASNTFQQPLIKWKGKTFNQIIASLQKNTNKITKNNPSILRRPLPQKIYRKEFASITNLTSQSQRAAIKIDNFNAPNGYSITNITDSLKTTLDINYINNTTDHPGVCLAFNKPCIVTESNAKKRVRSAGMYPKKYNLIRNNDSIYHSSTRDYLVSRSKTFQQNQYQYFRNGLDKKYKPGQTEQSYLNDYSAQGIQHCVFNGNISTTLLKDFPHKKVSYKPNNWKFATQGAVYSSGLTSLKNTLCTSCDINSYNKKKLINTFKQNKK